MKVPSFSTTMAKQRYDAEIEARQRAYGVAFIKNTLTKFYLVAEVDDGLPPIKQEISASRHAAFTAFENVDPSVAKTEDSVITIDNDVAD